MEGHRSYYTDVISLEPDKRVTIKCNGHGITKTLQEWHDLAVNEIMTMEIEEFYRSQEPLGIDGFDTAYQENLDRMYKE